MGYQANQDPKPRTLIRIKTWQNGHDCYQRAVINSDKELQNLFGEWILKKTGKWGKRPVELEGISWSLSDPERFDVSLHGLCSRD